MIIQIKNTIPTTENRIPAKRFPLMRNVTPRNRIIPMDAMKNSSVNATNATFNHFGNFRVDSESAMTSIPPSVTSSRKQSKIWII